MSLHGRTRLFRIVALDRVQDPLVVTLSALRTASNAKNPQALLPQQTNDGINQRQYDWISRRFGEGQMKIEIGLNESIGIPARLVHDGNGVSHRRKILGARANRSQSRDFWLQYFACFHQKRPAVGIAALDDAVQGAAHGIRGAVRDECPAARERVDQPLFLQRLDRLANRRSADAELLGEVSLGRELAAFGQFALYD